MATVPEAPHVCKCGLTNGHPDCEAAFDRMIEEQVRGPEPAIPTWATKPTIPGADTYHDTLRLTPDAHIAVERRIAGVWVHFGINLHLPCTLEEAKQQAPGKVLTALYAAAAVLRRVNARQIADAHPEEDSLTMALRIEDEEEERERQVQP